MKMMMNTLHFTKRRFLANLSVFLLCVLFFSDCISAAESIVIIRPLGIKYKKIEKEVTSGLGDSWSITIMTADSHLNESDIAATIAQKDPKSIVLIDNIALNIYKKYQQQLLLSLSKAPVPVVALVPSAPNDQKSGLKNGVVFSYDVPLSYGIARLSQNLQKSISTVGCIYLSSAEASVRKNIAQSNGQNFQVKLFPIPDGQAASAAQFRQHLYTAAASGIDALWLFPAASILNDDLISSVWKPFVENYSIPVCVADPSPAIAASGVFTLCINADFNGIGKQLAEAVKKINNDPASVSQLTFDPAVAFRAAFNRSPASVSVASAHSSPKQDTPATAPAVTAMTKQEDSGQTNASMLTQFSQSESTLTPPVTPIETVPSAFDDMAYTTESTSRTAAINSKSQGTIPSPMSQPASPSSSIKNNKSKPVPQTAAATGEKRGATDAGGSTVPLTIENTLKKTQPPPENPLRATAQRTEQTFPKRESKNSAFPALLFIGIFICAAAVAVAVFIRRRRSDENPQSKDNVCLWISRKNKSVPLSTNKKITIPLMKYLLLKGLNITTARNVSDIERFFVQQNPDIIFVDCQFSFDINERIPQILIEQRVKPSVFVIFYNITDLSKFPLDSRFPNCFHFDDSITIKALHTIFTSFYAPKAPIAVDTAAENDLMGKIVNYNLVEIFQLLSREEKTGCLIVENHKPVATIYMKRGRIVSAVSDNAYGKKAIFSALGLKEGVFRFIPNKKPIAESINFDVLGILLEWTKLIDETTAKNPLHVT
ncbi:MAG: DUF4388 domain-containing protein [Chitinivibrionales bacterium]|nr:DUF4388 domain-containing protein [Chitinivibrionales bacterium]